MLTVRELLKDLDVRLVAGEGGVDLPVRWVHITELTDPTPWLSGGELLLTTGLQLDTPERQREFVTRLTDHHLAGLGFGIGFEHETVPEPLIAGPEQFQEIESILRGVLTEAGERMHVHTGGRPVGPAPRD